MGKLSVWDQIVIKNLKRRSYKYQTNIYINLQLKVGIHWRTQRGVTGFEPPFEVQIS